MRQREFLESVLSRGDVLTLKDIFFTLCTRSAFEVPYLFVIFCGGHPRHAKISLLNKIRKRLTGMDDVYFVEEIDKFPVRNDTIPLNKNIVFATSNLSHEELNKYEGVLAIELQSL